MSNNGDAFRNGSTYLYKKRGGKLYWGPLWDFDLAAWDSFDYTSKNDIGYASFSEYPWFRQLYDKDPEFREKLLARIKEVDAVVRESAADGGKIDGFVREIYLSQKANYALCRSNLDITETDGCLLFWTCFLDNSICREKGRTFPGYW